MIARVVIAALICILGIVVFVAPTSASPSCIGFGPMCCVQPFPPGTFNCTYVTYSFMWSCFSRGDCPPWDAPLKLRCPFCHTGQAGNPIDVATGDTWIEENDLRVPGLGGGLTLARTWNSIWPASVSSMQVGLFGPNWRSTYEERVFSDNLGWMEYARGDGSFWAFWWNGTTWAVVSPANTTATLVQGTSSWTLTFQNGEQRVFDINSGDLTSIIDRNGNTTQIGYDAIGRMVSVTDPASRHIYLGYQSNSSYLVSSVTTDVGLSLSYTYDSQGRLTQVTNPDQSTLNFTYDSNSMISTVKDTAGKVLESHTYDSFGRGLTSSRANGVDAVTVTYPQQ